jgi:spore coat protein U-like protein
MRGIAAKRILLASTCAAAVLWCGATGPSLAGPVCSISNETALSFGTIYNPKLPQDGRASFVVVCARTQTVTISLLYSHRMRSATRGAELSYDLYSSAGRSSIWGAGGDGPSVSQTIVRGTPTTFSIYARIPAGQLPAAGDFTDTIEIVPMAF